MRARAMAVVAATVLAATLAAPPGPAAAQESAQETIDRLQRQGYLVTLDKMGTAPLSRCVVTSVRNPQTVTQWVPFVGPVLGGEGGGFLVPMVTSRTVSVSLDCTRR
jgi:hypothetical protein